MGKFAKFPGCVPFRRPAEEYGPGRLVDEYLENAIGVAVGWEKQVL
jgi:hypothetical protein